MRRGLAVAALIVLTLGLTCLQAGPIVTINNVPNWNQPNDYVAVPDLFVQPPDPPPYVDPIPALSGVANWCTPTAAANIMGWFEDTQGAKFAGLGDGISFNALPNRLQPYPNKDTNIINPGVPDGLPDYQQKQWLDGMIEMGYYMDTQGWKTGGKGHFGTSIGKGVMDTPGGIQAYLQQFSPGNVWTVWNYDIFNGGQVPLGWNDLLNGGTAPTLPVLGAVPKNGVNLGDPILVHWDGWINLGNKNVFRDNANSIDWYDWSSMTPGGHTVTGVGYASQIDPDFNPVTGANGPLPFGDYVICQDGWPNTGNPRFVAVPYMALGSGAPAQSYWQGNTHIEYQGEAQIPEPATMVLVGFGALGLLRRRRRAA